jgi:lipopolysaccharide transport system ATP-binding protein
MTKTVISVEHLTKQYDLGVIGTGTLSRDLNRWWARLRKQPDPYTRIGQQDHFERIGESILALDDVSFQVEQGEALGIIGKNGAGKSTLLKILSRVTAPTSGVVKVKGRIGSLLEVGTGFHPELTGRENVYLNGAILGMREEEVDRKFDEIVDFSGVEKFIDTPVKRYSSGMYVRLAFAVAAHLDPEILVVDEVLAVGDAEFQKKCLGKMGDVAGEGRTVLFVSHNMGAIQNLCTDSIWLKEGRIKEKGKSIDVVEKYLRLTYKTSTSPIATFKKPDEQNVWLKQAIFLCNDVMSPTAKYGDELTVEIEFESKFPIRKPGLGLAISNDKNEIILNTNNRYLNSPEFDFGVFNGVIRFSLGKIPLMSGRYTITLWFGENPNSYHHKIDNALSFDMVENDAWGRGWVPTKNLSHFWWPTEFEFIQVK